MGKNSEPQRRVVRQSEIPDNLSAEEGFLLSRMTHPISVKDLLPLCPWPEEETLKYIDHLHQKKAIEWIGEAPSAQSPKPELDSSLKLQLDSEEHDEDLKTLDRKFRMEILSKYKEGTNDNPYKTLGITTSASAHELKQKYLSLSKKFHPDRFFKKKLGHYKEKLEVIFSRIQKAYALLKDPREREAVDLRLSLKGNTSKKSKPEDLAKKIKTLDPKMEVYARAEKHYKTGLELQKKSDFVGAASSFALAYQTNPEREQYKKAYEDVKPMMHKQRAKELVNSATEALQKKRYNDVLEISEQALKYDPSVGEGLLMAGRAILELGLVDRYGDAKEMLLRSKASLPKNPDPCIYLAQVLVFLGEKKIAKKELEAALKRHPNHAGAKKLLQQL